MNCLMSKRRKEEDGVTVCLKGKLETFFYFYDFCVPIKAGSHGECEDTKKIYVIINSGF